MPTVNKPLDTRLHHDFNRKKYKYANKPLIIEIEKPDELMMLQNTHISSPLPQDELLIPLAINKSKRSYTYTPKRHRRRRRTHVTYKVYKHPRSKRSHSKRTSYRRSSRRTF